MKSLLALLLVTLLSPLALSQSLDADISLGSSFEGRLDSTSDVDLLRFEAVKNTQLTASLVGVKDKLIKGAPILLPQIEVLDLSTGDSLSVVTTGKKKVTVKKLLLPSTGEYLLRLSGTETTSGPYKVKTKGVLSKEGKVTKQSSETAASADASVSFDADEGFLLTLLVKPDKKSLAQPGAPTLSGPSGMIDLGDSVISNPNKFTHKLKKFALPEQGTYTLTSTNDGAEAGGIFQNVKLKPTKPVKEKLTEALGSSGVSIVRTLSGLVRNSNDGTGLAGVSVLAGDTKMATTDAMGRFIVHDPPMGMVEIHFDGSASPAAGDFEELGVMTSVAAVGETKLTPVVLPDLSNPNSALDTVGTSAGATTEPIDAFGNDDDIQLAGPTGTLIMVNGAPANGDIDFNVTPVDPTQVPMPLLPAGGAVDAASFVTVNPSNATFDNGNAGTDTGLDIVLPNDRGFPLGTMLDIWSFDHDAGDWVNRSAETGQQAEVVASMSGTQIVASGVITEGGWHAPVVPVDLNCVTTITGRVVTTLGQPIVGASVGSSTGQFATTNGSGVYTLNSVTAYDPGALPTCVATNVDVTAVTPVSFGAVEEGLSVAAVDVVLGGVTNVADLVVTVPETGDLAGLLVDNGVPLMDTVTIVGPAEGGMSVMSNANGSFFATGLDAGDYHADFTFVGDDEATSVDFEIKANKLTTLNLQRSAGVGTGSVTVLVLEVKEDSGEEPEAVKGAKVFLIGTDISSQAGVQGTTNAQGEAFFDNVDGPFTVTAQIDRVIDFGDGPESVRFAHSLVDIDPPEGVIGILSEIEDADDSPTLDATISGTITNIPTLGQSDFLMVQANGATYSDFTNADPVTGAYSIDVPEGDDYTVVFNHSTGVGQNENRTFSAQFVTGVDVSAGGNTTQDFDMDSPNAIDFDRQIDMSYTNEVSNLVDQVLALPVFLDTGVDFNLASFVFDVGALPATIFVPDATDPALTDVRMSVFLEQFTGDGIDDGVACDVFLDDNPTMVTLNMLTVPSFTAPTHTASIDVEDAPTMMFGFDDVPSAKQNGVVSLFLEGDGGDSGVNVDSLVWVLTVRAGTTSITLPPTVQGMFGVASEWDACLTSETFEGYVLDYDAAFGADVGDLNATVDGESDAFCEGFAVVQFTVD